MSELLRHPLTVLAVGALLTGILLPAVTSLLQRRRASQELKIGLVQQLTRAVATYEAALARLVTMRHLQDGPERHRERWDAANAAARDWHVESATLRAALDAHLGDGEAGRYLARLSDLLDESFALVYFVIDPRGDRVHLDASYEKLRAAAADLGVGLRDLPERADEYVLRSERESPVGTMWSPIADAVTAASSKLAALVLRSPVAWLEGGLFPRPRRRRLPGSS